MPQIWIFNKENIMSRKNKPLPILEDITIEAIAAEGKSIFHWTTGNEQQASDRKPLVVFVPFCVPGDVVDVQIKKKKHSFAEGEVVRFRKLSNVRVEPMCEHFGICGGCKWQMLPYAEQLKAKQEQVMQQLRRIGHVELPECQPILGSVKTSEYRNKLDFACSNKNWLTAEQMHAGVPFRPGIGFHISGAFDKVLPVSKCHLMDDVNNSIRNAVYEYAIEHSLSFFDLRQQTGLLRDIIIRCSNNGEWMVIVQFGPSSNHNSEEGTGYKEWLQEELISERCFDRAAAEGVLSMLAERFPQIAALMYVYNPKCNDTFGDLEVRTFKGRDHIFLLMEDLKFKVGPKSFYQTNTEQAYHLYSVAREFSLSPTLSSDAGIDSKDKILYDLYTGTGTIANFVARRFKKVVGIEYVPEAIEDAKVNSEINGIRNTEFFAGDMKDILTAEFIAEHGRPDTIITDPPRAGMHPDVINVIIGAAPQRIVYVSCNPATQARDLQLLDKHYRVMAIQPVDMFPHTPHVENVVLLEKRATI